MTETILIVEDDLHIASWISKYLENSGFKPLQSHDGQDGLSAVSKYQPDLIILDLMLPKLDGFEFCRELRKYSATPIIMLTARDSNLDKIRGLNMGADDYVTKPFDVDELLARVRALLRRSKQRVEQWLHCPPFSINPSEERVLIDGEEIELVHTQFKLSETFVRNPNKVLSRENLIEMSFGREFDGYDRSIDNHISRLRKIVNINGEQPIKTVYGAGYRFVGTKK